MYSAISRDYVNWLLVRVVNVSTLYKHTESLTSRFEVDIGGRIILETVAIATDSIGKTDRLTLLLQLL